MKKFLRVFALALFVAVAGVALAACGGKTEVKEEDIVGEWYMESYQDTYGDTTNEYKFTDFKALHDKGSARTPEEDDEYVDLETYFYMYKATADGKLQWKKYYADESEYDDAGTWAIENGELTTAMTTVSGEPETEYKNGKIIVTFTRTFAEQLQTQKIVLAKVA